MGLGLIFDVRVMDVCPSILFAAFEPADPCALGHIAFVPRKVKNMPIKVSGYAFVPWHAS